jgi:hypothetical protein
MEVLFDIQPELLTERIILASRVRPATLARNCCGRDGMHKKKGRLRCHKRPKSREETPNEGSDSEALPHTLAKMIAFSGSIEQT